MTNTLAYFEAAWC